jgi:hypothetical protein
VEDSANGVALTLNNAGSSSSLPLSVSAWVYPRNDSESTLVFALYKNSPFYQGPSVWRLDSRKFGYYDTGEPSTTTTSTTYLINNWHHVVLTITSGRLGILYVNGLSAVTFSGASNTSGLNWFIIGVDYDSFSSGPTVAGNALQRFEGKIDEVAVWNDVLTPDEVTAIYNSGYTLDVSTDSAPYESAANLQGYYRFNEGSGTSLQDSSSNSNTGTITGGTWTTGLVSE